MTDGLLLSLKAGRGKILLFSELEKGRNVNQYKDEVFLLLIAARSTGLICSVLPVFILSSLADSQVSFSNGNKIRWIVRMQANQA
jgi:hypothetical protein